MSVFSRKDGEKLSEHIPPSGQESRVLPASAGGAHVMGALAVGAVATRAMAIGALAIGKLAIGRARIRCVEIDKLVVGKLRVTEELKMPTSPAPESES